MTVSVLSAVLLLVGGMVLGAAAKAIPRAYADCDLPGKSHDDNNPSTSKFKQIAYHGSLCELAKCVDTEECSNHVKVDWDKFQDSPAYQNAEDDEQKALQKWHSDGHGAEGLVGYEVLQIVEGDY